MAARGLGAHGGESPGATVGRLAQSGKHVLIKLAKFYSLGGTSART